MTGFCKLTSLVGIGVYVAALPNALVHVSGAITQGDMLRVAFPLNVTATAIITLLFYFRVAG